MPGPPPLPLIAYPGWLKAPDAKPPDRKGGDPAGAPAGGGGTYKLPPEVKAGLEKAWKDSFPGGKSQEQGGILVRKKDGTLEWKPGKPMSLADGGSGAFSPNYGDVKKDETLVATAHTHPYTKAEGGHTNVTFSGGDLGNMAIEPREPMKFVRSGEGVFMVRTTEAFEKELKDKGGAKLDAEMRKTYKDAFDKFPGGVVDSAEAATKAVCEKYHLEYFKGKDDTLTKVDTSK
jgi:hypothetical protein